MTPEAPSRTAWGAARHRAVHQLLEGGRIFSDPLAVRILPGWRARGRGGAHMLFARTRI